MNADGSDQQPIASNSDQVAWAPNGRQLVINGNPRNEGEHLYVIDLDGRIVRKLDATSGGFGGGLGLSWAPARKIAYVYNAGDSSQEKVQWLITT
jgi:Tol biopolymer transport system component